LKKAAFPRRRRAGPACEKLHSGGLRPKFGVFEPFQANREKGFVYKYFYFK
jgi:hypothetical protein